MIGLIGKPEQKPRFAEIFGKALFQCLVETEELFLYVLVPLVCVAGLCLVGVVVYQLMFDPDAVDVASRLDTLSIDPGKWFPRS
jgi:hypothetical protein